MEGASGAVDDKRAQLIQAAIESLKEVGYGGTTIREIARRGGFNSALISYYFGGLQGLLLAALDHSSEVRMRRYRQAVAEAHDLQEMVDVARRIYREDLEGGHITVFTEMVGASLAHPDLAPELIRRAEPWVEFVEEAITKAVGDESVLESLPVKELAYSIICFYLGVNLMTHLDRDPARVEALFEVGERFIPLLQPFLNLIPRAT